MLVRPSTLVWRKTLALIMTQVREIEGNLVRAGVVEETFICLCLKFHRQWLV